MNELRKEENPNIPRRSHGTRRTVESKHSAAEPRNEENSGQSREAGIQVLLSVSSSLRGSAS
jgi:hypothetical protein